MEVGEYFCQSLFTYQRNATTQTPVGSTAIGGNNPIRVQSMTTTSTSDTEQSVAQCVSLIEAGSELVRLTAQGRREARNLVQIRKQLRAMGYTVPLVADIHFNPQAAEIAAVSVEKVRINPGNFAGGAKKFEFTSYTPEEEVEALEEIRRKLIPLLELCAKHGTALRIGVNHGSLSDRIMAKYGDTPQGMVQSCMEYLRICREENFHHLVLSIKASNTRVMVHTVRLLVKTMAKEGMQYPLHLGVTEAGSDDEGRIKSAVGIGALLADGIGDTIRVSLTEAPENEIPVARLLVDYVGTRAGHAPIAPCNTSHYSPFVYQKRVSRKVLGIGGDAVAVVVADCRASETDVPTADWVYTDAPVGSGKQLLDYANWVALGKPIGCTPVMRYAEWKVMPLCDVMVHVEYNELDDHSAFLFAEHSDVVILASSCTKNPTAEIRAFSLWLQCHKIEAPLVFWLEYQEANAESFQVISAADSGLLFLDGLADGFMLSNRLMPQAKVVETQFAILQASRVRFTKTDFISCPGCGRTLFDLQETTKEIKSRTGHLKGLKIGIMGCIVNGIGEMADADYGYVGAGPGKISLFRNREQVRKNLDAAEAVEALIELIRADGKWVDPL